MSILFPNSDIAAVGILTFICSMPLVFMGNFGLTTYFLHILYMLALLALAGFCCTKIRGNTRLRDELNALKGQNELFLLTEKRAHVGHWRVDFTNDEVTWSDETFRIYGLPIGAEPTLEGAIAAFHEEDRNMVACAVDTARKTGRPYTFEARLVRPDGEIRHTEAIAEAEFDENGEVAGIFGVFSDRTGEVELRRKMNAALVAAEQASKARTAFLAKMSHEIRTPLNGVVGFSDLLRHEGLPSKADEMVELIAESANNLSLLLNDILDISRIDAGELVIRKDPFDFSALISAVVQLFTPEAKEKGIYLRCEMDGATPEFLLGDSLRLRQILTNLISNAVKFTAAGGVRVKVSYSSEHLTISVTDTGPGIAKAASNRIFDPFVQENSDVEKSYGGTGLGLAISSKLANLMDGQLKLIASSDRGSEFELFLPAEIAQSPRLPLDNAPNNEFSMQRILLADDYDINQILVRDMARKAKLRLDVASDGQEAMAKIDSAEAERDGYALVLMDMQMPNIDGLEATRQIRANGICPEKLPILGFSANAYPEDIEKCLASGMQGHIAKPLTYENFVAEMRSLLYPHSR